MNQITIAPELFRNEIRNYSMPTRAFFRELFQNSIDAGARKITVDINEIETGIMKVCFADNGCGMDRETIEDVFLCLGKTTKSGANSIGGFGKARMLICYAMDSYEIRTHNTLVNAI